MCVGELFVQQKVYDGMMVHLTALLWLLQLVRMDRRHQFYPAGLAADGGGGGAWLVEQGHSRPRVRAGKAA